jgi:predicted component of type VI protein secretion system
MAKLRYWDMYRQWLEEITEDPDSFRELFGRDFVRAYEAFVQRLESRSEGRREGEAKR